jgi:hypothetical protein
LLLLVGPIYSAVNRAESLVRIGLSGGIEQIGDGERMELWVIRFRVCGEAL